MTAQEHLPRHPDHCASECARPLDTKHGSDKERAAVSRRLVPISIGHNGLTAVQVLSSSADRTRDTGQVHFPNPGSDWTRCSNHFFLPGEIGVVREATKCAKMVHDSSPCLLRTTGKLWSVSSSVLKVGLTSNSMSSESLALATVP